MYQVATTSKEIREGGNSVEAEMDEVMNAVDEEMRNTENNPEEEELMVCLDSRSLNRSRKKFQKRKLFQQLSTTPSSLLRMQCPFSIRHEVLPGVNCQLSGFDDDVGVFSKVIYSVHGFFVFHSTAKIVHHFVTLHKTFHCGNDKLTPTLVGIVFFFTLEWTLHPKKRGVTPSLYEWKKLKKTIPLFEDREPELRTMDNKVTGED
jgi:hypothetical protein